MINYLTLLIIKIFDFFHKKKIINFLKNKKYYKFNTVLDVGAHYGESIELFLENFDIKKIISFEASPENFKTLKARHKNLSKTFSGTDIVIENLATGNDEKLLSINQFTESSSSTIKNIDENSKYFKKKFFFLKNKNKLLFRKLDIKVIKLKNYLIDKNVKNIDFLKIDTEGYEKETILGLDEKIKNVKLIFFEHHYDNMIIKNYKFRDLNKILVENNFFQILKIKMPLRKSFEYIYQNKKTLN